MVRSGLLLSDLGFAPAKSAKSRQVMQSQLGGRLDVDAVTGS
jgi:hypothetical protein